MKPILLDFPERYESDRLILSIYEHGDGKEFFKLLQDNYAFFEEELFEVRKLKNEEDAEEFLRYKRIEWLSRKRMVPKIVEKETNRMIGQLWIEPKWDRMIFEVGYFIEEKSQGKGFITEAVNKMIEILFDTIGANRLEIHTKATNTKSIGVAERCGFTKEAHIRERGRTNAGEIVDMVFYGLLKSEYTSD